MSANTSKQTQVLGIIGSPRKDGNTVGMVESILNGAESVGAMTKSVFLGKLTIKPCIACDKCLDNQKCIYDDDVEMVFGLMKEADVWVFGTPVYWWGPTAQLKAFIDRWYAYQKPLKKLLPDRRIALAIPFGDTPLSTADHTIGMFRESFQYLGKHEIDEIILAPSVHALGEIKQKPDILEAGFKAGVKLAS